MGNPLIRSAIARPDGPSAVDRSIDRSIRLEVGEPLRHEGRAALLQLRLAVASGRQMGT